MIDARVAYVPILEILFSAILFNLFFDSCREPS